MNQSVKLAINETRLVKNLGFAFSNKSTVLAELLQNGRRAGATDIYVEFDAETNTLIVTDNGSGIETMQNLLTVAESGWDAETQANEHPFGMGFLSALFAAEHVIIESRGKKMAFDTAHALEFGDIAVDTSNFIGGARITMQNFVMTLPEVESAMKKYAEGFPLDVYLNGKLQSASLSLHEMGFIKTPIGHVRLGNEQKMVVFLQGLPIFRSYNIWSAEKSATIIHLDSMRFFARMPDRDKLIDEALALKTIGNQVQEEWRKIMDAKKKVMDAEAFVAKYWALAKEFNIQDVMNDVPVIPASILREFDEYPTALNHQWSALTQSTKPVTRSQVESGEVVLCLQPGFYLEDNLFAAIMYARQKGWVVVEQLPVGHWGQPYVKDVELLNAELVYTTTASDNFGGIYVCAEIHLCDEYQIIVDGDAITINDEAVAFGDDSHDCTIVVPCRTDGSEALAQACSYLGERDDYQENEHEEDQDNFIKQVSVLRGEDPAITMAKVLQAGNAGQFDNLLGGLFMVQVRGRNSWGNKEQVIEASPLLAALFAAKTFIQNTATDSQESAIVLEQIEGVINQVGGMKRQMLLSMANDILGYQDNKSDEMVAYVADYFAEEIERGNHTLLTVYETKDAAVEAFKGGAK